MNTLSRFAALAVAAAVGYWLISRPAATAPLNESPSAPVERVPSIETVATAPAEDGPAPPPVAVLPPTPAQESAPLGYPPLDLDAALLGAQSFFDELLGVRLSYPEGWSVRSARRWGELNRKTTVVLQPPDGSRAQPSMYYQLHVDAPPGPEGVEAFLREQADWKENSRRESGFVEYENDRGSFVFRTFEGKPSMRYFATYLRGNEVYAEYFMRVLGPEGYVMFFTRGPVEDVQAQIPAIFEMGSGVKPPGTP